MVTVNYLFSGGYTGAIAPSDQFNSDLHSITALSNGDFLAATTTWQPSSSYGVIRDAAGHVVTPNAFEIGGVTAVGTQVAGLSNGGAVAVFADGADHMRAQIFDANGNALASDFALNNDTHAQHTPDVAGLKDGGFVAVWERDFSASDQDIRGEILNADGSFRANLIVAATNNNETTPAVAALTDGGFAVTWSKQVGLSSEVWEARYDANGNVQDGGAHLVDNIGLINREPDIVGLKNGGFAIAYEDSGWAQDPGAGITLATFDANGHAQGYFLANQGQTDHDQEHASITTLSNGDIAVGWTTIDIIHQTDDSLGLAFFDQNGNFLTNGPTPFVDHATDISLAGLANGTLVAAYTNELDLNSDYKVFDLIRQTTGTNANDTLTGDSLRDIINGGPGADKMTGGAGDDTYYVDNPNDVVIEKPGEGNDGVVSTINYTLPANVENLQLIGTGQMLGIGNDLDNIIQGNNDGDVLYGNGGKDTLIGGTGVDFLDGGPGADAMYGGKGNDEYEVDNAADTVHEQPGEGTDTVHAYVNYTLPHDVENLVLMPGTANGTGNGLDNVILGNNSDNVLKGMDGNDTLWGAGGNDTLDGGAGDDTAHYSGSRFDYHVSQLANGDLQITDLQPGSPDGTDTVRSVEHFAFNDGTITAAALVTPASVHWSASVDAGAHPAGYQPAAIGDFNGDGTSDVLWFNPANNSVDLWQISNGQWAASSDLGSHPAGYQVAGTGDFNHDGTSDVLWFNSATNDAEVWMIQNGHWAASSDIGSHPAGYQVAGTGDFNHDGTSDVLWYNAATNEAEVWTIQNGHWAASTDIGTHPAGFQIAGVGDFNHDGTTDVLWFNQATGETDLWMINNGHWAGSSSLGVHPAGYQPVAVGDFAHDGNADILWYNPATGDTDLWKLFDGHWAGSDSLGAHPAGWQPAGAGNFNHDGVADVAWFNAGSNHLEEWLLGNS